jgi:iron complex outermembrane receptor protein
MGKMNRSRSAGLMMALLTSAGWAGMAYAQTADEPSQLEEIVVTARKRAETVQTIPIAITAVTGAELNRRAATDFEDIARSLPGVTFSSSEPGQRKVAIRGIVDGGSLSDPTIGIYLDEMAVTGPGSDYYVGDSDLKLFDLERVEVLRGPQGTLYGAGSLGGTLRYITNRPNLEKIEGSAYGSVSNTEGGAASYGFNGAVSIPLVEGKAAARLAVLANHDGGYIDRVDFNGKVTDENSNSVNTTALRASFLLKPMDDFEIYPQFIYQKTKARDRGVFASNLDEQIPTRITQPQDDQFTMGALTMRKGLGPVDVVSVSSYSVRDLTVRRDFTDFDLQTGRFIVDLFGVDPADAIGYRDTLFTLDSHSKVKQFSQELRLESASDSGRLRWTVGAYYLNSKKHRISTEKGNGINDASVAVLGPFLAQFVFMPDDLIFQTDNNVRREQFALFGDATFNITDQLHLSAGLRAFRNRRANDVVTSGFLAAPPKPDVSTSEEGVNPRVILDYQATPDMMVYASAAKGFRPGGPNNAPSAACQPLLDSLGFDPNAYDFDSVWTYEAGAKTQFADRRVTLNAAAYVTKWKDIQQIVPLSDGGACSAAITANAGEATVKGIELEARFNPARGLQFGGYVAFSDATFDEDQAFLNIEKGEDVQFSPKWTYAVFAEYNHEIQDGLSAFGRVDYQWRSSARRNFDDKPGDSFYAANRQPSYGVLSAKIGIERGPWTLAAFANNITNEQPVLDQISNLPDGTIPGLDGYDLVTTLRPRVLGVELRVTY